MEHPVYCEQPVFSGFFEPFNTITNIFFIIAGILLIYQLKKSNKIDAKAIYLSTLLIIIGIGSFAWHLYRKDFTLLIDSIPIGIFILSYLYFYLTITTEKLYLRITIYLGFYIYTILLSYLLKNLTNTIVFGNGGLGYIIAISYFILLQAYNYFKFREIVKKSLIISFILLTSILLRQLDLSICNTIAIGTHFIWHTLNSIVLYLFVKLLYFQKFQFNIVPIKNDQICISTYIRFLFRAKAQLIILFLIIVGLSQR